jgi:hypothetical protein
MLEQTVNLPINDAYSKLKDNLLEKDCKLISEQPPECLVAKQGSLWGISPQNAKKKLTCKLKSTDSKTTITVSSKLSSDWVNITLIGTAFSIGIVGLCLWISVDLTTFLSTNQASTWSWIASVGSYVDHDLGESFVRLTWILSAFLSVIIASEIVIYLYAKKKIDAFAKEILLKDQS